ncbi:MAG: peptidase T, partial [Deltaproteobacteria bacterium]|nr:peptidase T [Deltaproteobacteria bacterium]
MNTKRMIDDFVKYTKIDTTADPESKSHPSSPGQLELAKIITDDLKNAGADNVETQEDGFIFATITDNVPDGHPAKGKVPTIGFLSHLDTANEASGANVKVQFVENYQGGDIKFPGNPELTLNNESAPNLKKCIGHTIMT